MEVIAVASSNKFNANKYNKIGYVQARNTYDMNLKPKICFMSNAITIHDQRFLENFMKNGYEIIIITFKKNYSEIQELNKLEDISGIKYYNLPVLNFKKISIIKKIINTIKCYKFTRRIIRKEKPDILHAGYVQKYGFIAALTGFKPFLLMPKGSDVLIEPYKSILYRFITKYTFKAADIIQCDADFVKECILDIRKMPENKVVVFPQLGVDLEKFKPQNSVSNIISSLDWKEKKIIIMSRYLKPVYGIEYFFDAIMDIIKQEDFRVIMCGDGPLRRELEDLISKNGIEDYVHFAGHVKNEALPALLNSVHVYVSTSLSDGTSLSLLEAMACGLPVIVSDVPAIKEWVKDGYNGFVVPRKDSAILKKRIVELLNDNRLMKTFGERNLKISKERSDIKRNFEKLESIYAKLLKPNA